MKADTSSEIYAAVQDAVAAQQQRRQQANHQDRPAVEDVRAGDDAGEDGEQRDFVPRQWQHQDGFDINEAPGNPNRFFGVDGWGDRV